MKYLKTINEFKKGEENFIHWLSMKFGKKIGNYLGSGMWGYVYEFGYKKVIKISTDGSYSSKFIANRNIKGIAKIYSYGKIKIPIRFIENGSTLKIDDLKRTMSVRYVDSLSLSYIIMEKLMITTELVNKIADIQYALDSYIDFLGFDYIVEGDNGLKELFDNINDDDFIQKTYNYITDGFKIDESLFAELVVIFKNISKHFDWVDVHPGQFGRNYKGELVAFDLDNPTSNFNNSDKHIIHENNTNNTY